MFSFKKKDRDKAESKEEKRERRKREKAEKEGRKHAHDKKQADPTIIGDIVAGSTGDLDDKKGTRFSFRKRKYDVDHEFDEENRPVSNETGYDVRQSYSSSDGDTKHGSAASTRDDYVDSNYSGAYSERIDRNSEPVPAPRRKKTSSVEIKLSSNSTDSMNGDQRHRSDSDRDRPYPAERSYRPERNDHEHKTKSLHSGGRTIALSGTPNRDKQDPIGPPKPPRVVKPDDTGVVEFRLVNSGVNKTSYMGNEPREIVTVSSVSNSYSSPYEDFMDASMEEKPIKIDSSSPLETASSDITIDITSPTEKSFEDLGVDLTLPEVVPASPGIPRVIKIQRRMSGDFGFALRRGTESGNDKTVHFVEPVGPNTATGILPGDRLIEVNGVNVEDVDREKIIEMIAMSGNEVVIKVVPVSELSELSVRSGLDGSSVQLDESNLKAGTLQRSGSKRMKKKPKSAEETASQKAWQDAEKVWVVHKAGFSGGRVQRIKSAEQEEDETPMCKVKLDHGGEVITIEEESIEKANPPQYDRAEDLASLRYLNESSCLHTLRQRHGSNLIHTYAGPNLIVVNPNQNLAIYTDKVIQMFRGCKQEDMPPHIFAAAQTAYRNMLAARLDQSIVMMGASGSGKTTCAKHILHYLSVTAASNHSAVTDQKFEGIFALLEAFGNAPNKLNKNASKLTLLVSLDFDSAGLITCGTLQTFLLEKSRVVRQPEGEGPFHIFKYLLAGSDAKLRKELQLDRALSEHNDFISDFDPLPSETQRLSNKWTEIEFALNMLGISVDEAKSIWSCLAAIYHLGGAGINIGQDNKPHFTNPAAVQRAAAVLGTTQEELTEIIFAPPPVNQFTIRMRQKSSDSMSPPSSAEATPERQAKSAASSYIEALEGFAIGLYQEALSALMKIINRSLQCGLRSVSTIHVLDSPGFQNPTAYKKEHGATFEDLCHNYETERLQKFFHHTVFTSQMERYAQENIECSFESNATSPDPVVGVFDKAVQGLTRGSTLDLKNEQKGLLWILDEESIFPGANDSSFLARVYVHHCSDKQSWVKQGPRKDTFYVNHCQGTIPVLYNAKGWLKQAREHSTAKQAKGVLSDSSKPPIADMFSNRNTGDSSISRSRSFKRTSMSPSPAIKKNSQCLQLIYQVDTILEAIRKTQVNFVRTIVPVIYDASEGSKEKAKDLTSMDVPLARLQLRAAEMLDAIRIHRQGYPEHMPFAEFRRRFDILAPTECRNTGPVLDEKKGVETLLEHLDLDKRSYRLGLSQIFFRAGSLAQLEDARDEKNTGTIVELQSLCRGYLARRKFKKLQVQNRAMFCIQKNLRVFAAVRNWPWWRLYTKVLPLLNVHRAEEELKSKSTEVDALKAKIIKLENENRELNGDNEKLEQKVAELSAALAEDRAASNHANQELEQETMERMRLERSYNELQESYDEMKKKKEKLSKDLADARAMASSAARPIVKLERYQGEGASNDEDEDDEDETFYRDRYLQASRQHDELRRRIQDESDKVVEELTNQKRALERKLTEEKAENDELHRTVSGLKKKSSRLNAEMEDLKLVLEDEQSRNAELEKKQRKFDIESNRFKEEVSHERNLKDKINREKEKYQSEKYRLEKELEDSKDELERLTKENETLNRDINDMSGNLGTKVDGDSVALKKTIRELEQKVQDQEEELDEQAGEIQVLEQAKLRLEMAAEREKVRVQKELEAKDEEVEDIRQTMQKKMKQLEAQQEDEHEEKTALIKAKRDMERRLQELRDSYERDNAENERRLRRELKRTKALLRDAQTVIDTMEKKMKDKNQVKILKDKLEDAEYSAQVALKGKKKIEEDLKDVQSQLDSLTKSKIEVENKYFTQLKEATSLQSRVEEDEEEIEALTEKNRQMMKQLSTAETQLREMDNLLQETIAEKESLEAKISNMATRMEYLEGSTVDKQQLNTMDSKMRELETKLDLEGSTKRRQDVQVNRLKEQVLRVQEERDDVLLRETKLAQENLRLERHMREIKEEADAIEKRETEWKKKKSEMEREMEALEVDLASAKQELSLAKKRVSELQHALEDDMNYDSDGLSHENSDLSDDSDTNIETSSAVPSEPRSYRSIEDLENDDELELKLKKKLTEIKDSTDTRSETGSSSTRRTSASASLSPKSDKDDSKDESRRRKSDQKSREDRRKKSIEKRKSLERMSRKAKRDTPGAFDI